MIPNVGARLRDSHTVKRTPPQRKTARLSTVLSLPASTALLGKWLSKLPYPTPPSTTGLHRIPESPSGFGDATSPRPVTRVIAKSVSLTFDAYVPPATPF